MFDNICYQRLLTALEESIFPHITETRTDTGGVAGRAREPVLFQIDHGTAHLKRVRKNMEILLAAADAAPKRRLTLEDPQRFIALAAATFHDLGMHFGWYTVHPDIHEPITQDRAAIVRKDHGRISAEWFRRVQPETLPPELNLPRDLAEILSDPWLLKGLAFVIEAHQWGLGTLEERLRNEFPDEDDRCWMRGLACLVKLADTLDMDSRRVNRSVVERAVNALLGRPSDIRANLDDVGRMLMVYYLNSASCRPVSPAAGFVLELALCPRVPSSMLTEPFRPFLDYLTGRYKARLDPADSFIARTIRDLFGIVFTQIDIPQFKVESSLYPLPESLLPELLASIEIRESRIDPALLLEDWVRSRWPAPSDGRGGIQPHWDEFERNEIFITEETCERLDAILASGDVALLSGQGACGKSVFAVAYARLWAQKTGGKVFWLDLREQDRLVMDGDLSFLDGFSGLQLPHKLIVIDNAHIDEAFIRRFLDRLVAMRSGKCLLLARPAYREAGTGGAGLHDRLAACSDSLAVDARSFRRTAERLMRPLGGVAAGTWGDEDYARWVDEFGADLIAFGQALREATPGVVYGFRPSQEHALAYVRARYLDEAEGSSGGKDAFLRFCALAALDLQASDDTLGGACSNLYPSLVDEGLALPIYRGPFRLWQFAHAGLAELILRAAAPGGERFFREQILDCLLGAAERTPYVLGPITQRLGSGRYSLGDLMGAWRQRISDRPGLLERCCAAAPQWAGLICRRLDLFLGWSQLSAGAGAEELLASLLRLPADQVLNFLRFAGERRAEPMVERLLAGDDHFGMLHRTPPDHLPPFLKFVGERRAAPIVERLLADDGYFGVLCRTQPDHLTSFLRFVGERRAEPIVERLLAGDDYFGILRRTPSVHLPPFLKFIGERRAVPIVKRLLADDGYFGVLCRTPPDHLTSFLKVVGERRAAPIVERLLAGDDYFSVLVRTLPSHAIPFLKYAGTQRAKPLVERLVADPEYRALVKRSNIVNTVPLFDFVQSHLPGSGSAEYAAALLRECCGRLRDNPAPAGFEFSHLAPVLSLSVGFGKDIAEDLLAWMVENEAAFCAWAENAPPVPRAGLGVAIKKADIHLPEPMWKMLWDGCGS